MSTGCVVNAKVLMLLTLLKLTVNPIRCSTSRNQRFYSIEEIPGSYFYGASTAPLAKGPIKRAIFSNHYGAAVQPKVIPKVNELSGNFITPSPDLVTSSTASFTAKSKSASPPKIQRHVFFYSLPEEQNKYYPPSGIPQNVTDTDQKHYKIIFIKTPPVRPQLTPDGSGKVKTLIYILMPKSELYSQDKEANSNAPQLEPPEVYFLSYNPNNDKDPSFGNDIHKKADNFKFIPNPIYKNLPSESPSVPTLNNPQIPYSHFTSGGYVGRVNTPTSSPFPSGNFNSISTAQFNLYGNSLPTVKKNADYHPIPHNGVIHQHRVHPNSYMYHPRLKYPQGYSVKYPGRLNSQNSRYHHLQKPNNFNSRPIHRGRYTSSPPSYYSDNSRNIPGLQPPKLSFQNSQPQFS